MSKTILWQFANMDFQMYWVEIRPQVYCTHTQWKMCVLYVTYTNKVLLRAPEVFPCGFPLSRSGFSCFFGFQQKKLEFSRPWASELKSLKICETPIDGKSQYLEKHMGRAQVHRH